MALLRLRKTQAEDKVQEMLQSVAKKLASGSENNR